MASLQTGKFTPVQVKAELDRYFRYEKSTGSTLGEVLSNLVNANKKARDKHLLFEGEGVRGYVEVDYYANSSPMDQYAYVRETKCLVITHVMIEPRGNKQVDKAVKELFEQTDLGAVVVQAIILDEVMDYFESKGWVVDRDARNATLKRPASGGTRKRRKRRRRTRR